MLRPKQLTPADLLPKIERLWQVSATAIESIEASFAPSQGSPVCTAEGRYATRRWTEWTQGFRYGSALLQYDATGDERFLQIGRNGTLGHMVGHLSHTGVHDHGFTTVSTFGNLWRLVRAGRAPAHLLETCELAIKVSGAVQAARWRPTPTVDAGGYIYSFNGPHSLFVDTIRSLRVLGLAHLLGQVLMGEADARISLLDRLIGHGRITALFNVYYGTGRDTYDTARGRTAHESLFNTNDGGYRCPSTQQGYSPFSTWTRGLAWAMLGFAEQLEFLAALPEPVDPHHVELFTDAARATCDFYLAHAAAADGVPYWDTGAPGLAHLDGWADRPADPYNAYEPVDSSAAAIGAQGLLRLGRVLGDERYTQGGLTVAETLFDEPYLSVDPEHQGLILHSVYHRPNGWDHVAPGQQVPNGESSMWGDYHARELALYLQRLAAGGPYYTFFGDRDQ